MLFLAFFLSPHFCLQRPSHKRNVGTKLSAGQNEGKDFGYATAAGPHCLAFGAPGDEEHGALAGAVYLFTDQNGSIVPQGKLTPLDAGPGTFFGSSLAASGDLLLIGADRDSDIVPSGGSAYIFRKTGSTWSQEAKLIPPDGVAQDHFGSMVALNGDVAAVTAIDQDAGANGAGAVYLFVRSGSAWSFSTKITHPQPVVGGRLGHSVGVFGDWVTVGSNITDRVRVYRRTGATWPLVTTLTAVGAPPGETGFGSGMAIGSDFLAVSALHLNNHQGVVYLFRLVDGNWVFHDLKESPDHINLAHFGWKIAMTDSHLAVGAQFTRKMFLYQRIGDQWRYESVVRSSTPSVDDGFGSVVATGATFAIAGAPIDQSVPVGTGAGYAFPLSQCVVSIPAVNSWGLIALTLSLLIVGSWVANGRTPRI